MQNCIQNHVGIITNNVICSEQHGFLKGKSCSTQLTDVYHYISLYLDSYILNYFDLKYIERRTLPHNIRISHCLHSFKRRLKCYFNNLVCDCFANNMCS